MSKISSLLEKCKYLENSLLIMEMRMIITLINAGIEKGTVTNIVKKTVRESNYFTKLELLRQEIELLRQEIDNDKPSEHE